MDDFKRESAISIYGCPHDVVFCKRCQKKLRLNRRARRRLKEAMKKTLCMFLLTACSALPSSSKSRPTVSDSDAPGTEADCQASCAARQRLHCPSADPTPSGASCVEQCLNVETSGYVTLHPRCVAQITSCDQEAACSGE